MVKRLIGLISINKCIIEVEQIRSYQTLLYKNGYRSFPTKAYKLYKQELHLGMRSLKPIPKETPIKCVLRLNASNGVNNTRYLVKMLTTDNTSRAFDNKAEAEEYHDSNRHYIEKEALEIKYGVLPDVDNAVKPIIDYMEEMGIIDNDRHIVEMVVVKTFGNETNTIEIELEELEIVDDDKVTFRGTQ